MYLTDYHKSFVLCYVLHYYPFVEDHQVSIMAYQVFDHNGLVGRPGLEPGEVKLPVLQTGPLPATVYRPIYG